MSKPMVNIEYCYFSGARICPFEKTQDTDFSYEVTAYLYFDCFEEVDRSINYQKEKRIVLGSYLGPDRPTAAQIATAIATLDLNAEITIAKEEYSGYQA